MFLLKDCLISADPGNNIHKPFPLNMGHEGDNPYVRRASRKVTCQSAIIELAPRLFSEIFVNRKLFLVIFDLKTIIAYQQNLTRLEIK